MLKMLCKFADEFLVYFTDYSLVVDWYNVKFGKKILCEFEGLVGYYCDNFFYPLDSDPYFCKCASKNFIRILDNSLDL